jgi:dTDP-4-dehydrorhamnose 3,5-epimerase
VEIFQTPLPGVVLLKPKVYEDARGFFMETYRADVLAAAGIHDKFVQDNHARSVRGVLRGLHYQLRHPQAKLCRVASGEVFDVAVDIRAGSPTFGQWYGATLSGENKLQIYLPPGFAHGYVVRSETVDFLYKCSDYHSAEDGHGVLWSDPQLAIPWDTSAPILADKDQHYAPLADVPRELLPRYIP